MSIVGISALSEDEGGQECYSQNEHVKSDWVRPNPERILKEYKKFEMDNYVVDFISKTITMLEK